MHYVDHNGMDLLGFRDIFCSRTHEKQRSVVSFNLITNHIEIV